MALIRHDDYVRDRAACDPEFARLRRQTASDLLDGNDEDRGIAIHILRDQLGLSEDEIQALQFARANALRDAAYFVRFGDYRLDACDYADAIAYYDRAIALAPDDADAYHNRGVTKAEQGDYAGAIFDYDRVIALDPDNVAVYDDRAVAKAAQGNHAGAIADYGTYDDSGSLEHKETTV